ncbi:hypothetical protein [Shewanella baltica]|uniref:Uncharacterized protein n=1 Tax=Shewanella baltica (strain OS155 / ATCC BAA-1091) TaxID=325240 RepID=A3DB28_SHEB5|nr:hypothetical protein [Shewanella baltica]ABN63941.1 hypothetical protein Sbal_4389 [Shewanella baltica OS155]AEH16442.1 hypothetical protein Sbal117_4820 [Shewanella baltica OS117]
MSNTDKRIKRAKNKAKQARLKKQKTQERSNQEQVVCVPPDVAEMFQTLPSVSSEYEAVPYLKKHVLSGAVLPHDVEMSVAILYVMYGNWRVLDSDAMYLSDLLMVAEQITEHPKFIEQFYQENGLLAQA